MTRYLVGETVDNKREVIFALVADTRRPQPDVGLGPLAMLLREVHVSTPRPLLYAASVVVLSILAAVTFASLFLSLLGAR